MVRLFDAGRRDDDLPVVVHERVLTLANGITALRLLGLPLFVWLMVGPRAHGLALLTLFLTGSSDWVDGYIARRFDQVTKLGQLIDPLIDRALLATAGITLAAVGFLPWWIVAAVVGRDLVILLGALIAFGGNPQIPVTRLGKAATACLLVGIPAFLVANMDWAGAPAFWPVAWVFSTVGLVTYYAAGVIYARTARRMLALRAEGEQQ